MLIARQACHFTELQYTVQFSLHYNFYFTGLSVAVDVFAAGGRKMSAAEPAEITSGNSPDVFTVFRNKDKFWGAANAALLHLQVIAGVVRNAR